MILLDSNTVVYLSKEIISIDDVFDVNLKYGRLNELDAQGEAEATHPNASLGCPPLGSPSDV